MNTIDALNHMLKQAGRSRSDVSQAIGRHRNFITSSLNRGSWNPTTLTLHAIAQECGYKLVLMRRGDRIEIDT
ncbi:hypothetical protein KPC83_02255 [Collinsella sp. zg1085]|uniref:hypothetical protein n=1 Tax=Collinsella sp. zg1085 TaxID=2844380 RepID=UPI001C0C3033|nr:hypothetical protein [Collinsella sp. zg1085]QWT17982.1 hypothetical protein KPC83_02255 [Collinsella sp. zg1085]